MVNLLTFVVTVDVKLLPLPFSYFPASGNFAEALLFRWTPHRGTLLREFWKDFVLVMETLEENQVDRPA